MAGATAYGAVPFPEVRAIPRQCSTCNSPDRLLPVVGADPGKLGSNEHFVKPEWIPMERGEDDREFRRYLRAGWTKKVLDGRLGVERYTCISCLNANHLRDSIWSELKANARKLEAEQNKGDDYYMSLVEEW